MLAARPAGEPERLNLKGRTSKGQPVRLAFVDGQLQSADVRAWARCPDRTDEIPWSPTLGTFGDFHQDGSTFRVRQLWEAEGHAGGPAGHGTLVLLGELSDDSARGSLTAVWVEGEYVCRGTVRFSAG